MLESDAITKSFSRDRKAVDAVSFAVQRGEIFGLLGHNGAGKSTLLGCMLGMIYPDHGEIRIAGLSVQKNRNAALRKVGAIFEAPVFYDYLSGWRNLKILCALSGFTDATAMQEVVRLVRLEESIHQRVRTYSHGMRQRLALAQALLPTPELLLLDEPTDGLDPEGIREFRDFVLGLRAQLGLTILFNSHLLAEVELLCDRVAIIKNGRLLYVGDGTDLRGSRRRIKIVADDPDRLAEVLAPLGLARENDDFFSMPKDVEVAEMVEFVVKAGVKLREVTPQKETLEELYLKVSA